MRGSPLLRAAPRLVGNRTVGKRLVAPLDFTADHCALRKFSSILSIYHGNRIDELEASRELAKVYVC